ncbi:MAG: hypothetical protein J1F14_05470 [Treponema sp.]|nr:hypothetical protein [Treponema sp.]
MDDQALNVIDGRKTFFIVPDTSLLPESYLEDYMARGYETYIIEDDRVCPLEKKVEAIITIFYDSILFFYVDAVIPGIEWRSYIQSLQKSYGNKVLIGVLYAKRNSPREKQAIEKYYLFDVGIQCGCISLEYQKEKNFGLIDKVMYANQAAGRRKNIRALCDSTSKVNFTYKKKQYNARLTDISLSHFSCSMDDNVYIPLYEKLSNIYVEVNNMHFTTDGILLLERTQNGENLYVFVFVRRSDGKQGLEWDIKQRLSERIYTLVTSKVKNILQLVFSEIGRGPGEFGGRNPYTPQDLERLL